MKTSVTRRAFPVPGLAFPRALRGWLPAILMAFAAARGYAAGPGGTSYTGTFATDDAQQTFTVTLPASGPLTIRTYSYAGGTNQAGAVIPAGGFDPTVSLFDSAGNLLLSNQDGGCGPVAAEATTKFCWDAYLAVTLPAGSYTVVLTQSQNLPNGPALSNGFAYTGQPTFTTPPGAATLGFWDLFPNKRTSSFALDIVGGASAVTGITSGTPPGGTAGQGYSFTFTSNAPAATSLTWSVTSGALPLGLSLNAATGVLSGVPQNAGNSTFTVQVTDGGTPKVSQSYTIAIGSAVVIIPPPPVLTISSIVLPNGTGNQPYVPITLTATGGSGNYSWKGTGFPSGIGISAGGVISGTPLAGGSFQPQISVSDQALGGSGSTTLSLTIVVSPLTITSLGGGATASLGGFVPTAKMAGNFTATGGIGAYSWSATGLPPGIAINGLTGAFSGTAGVAGVYSFTLRVADAETPALAATQTVGYSVLGLAQTSLPNGSTTAVYSASLVGLGGTGPYTFSAAANALPGGLSLSGAGVFGGTPTAAGNYSFLVTVASGGLSTQVSLNLTVTAAAGSPLTVTAATLPTGVATVPYGPQGLQATGGSAPYTWAIFGGLLPGGMSLSGAGNLLGTPATAGSYSFTAQVTDAKNATATGTFSLNINPVPLTLSLGTFPVGVATIAYPLQILTPLASGGLAPYTFAVTTGSLPAGLTLSGQQISGTPTAAVTSNFTVTVTDATGKTATATGSILINPQQTSLILSQTTVSFQLTAGANGVPTPGQVTVRSSDVATLLNYGYSISPVASWLQVTGWTTTPGALTIALDPSAPTLAASATPYATVITVTCVGPGTCAGATQTINVSLTVTAPPPQLTLSSSLLSFSASGASPAISSQTLGLQNSGGGVITVNSITPGASWLSVSGVPATLAAGPGASVVVSANPLGLSPGYYTSALAIATSTGTTSFPVTLLVTDNLTMTLGPAGTQYSAPQGSSPGNTTGAFSVSVTGSGTVNWNASLLPGANWLTLNAASGSSTAAVATFVTYTLNAGVIAALAPATYYATIQVSAPGVVDNAQQYQVVLNITPPAIAVSPVLSTAGLIFVSIGGATPTAQNVQVYTSSAAPSTPYQASATTTDGAAWLSVSPPTGLSTVQTPGQSAVSVNVSGLAAGLYSGGVSYAFASDAVRTVNVTLLVVGSGPVAALRNSGAKDTASPPASCAPSKLIPTQTGLYGNFAQPAGWPTPLSVNLINDCGSPVNGASMTTTFSNGDPPLALSPRDSASGIYLGTWTPRNPAPQVTVTATASAASFPAAVSQVTGQVRTNGAPLLTPNGTLDVFNPVVGQGLAPGQVVQIYGNNLASGTVLGPSPLSTALSGTTLLIGGIPMPLYYVSAGQIDAQIPFELTPGKQYQMVVVANGALSTPLPVNIVGVAPGLANINGGVLSEHGLDGSLITEASPAKPSEFVVLFLSGMGATDNPVADGAPSPSNPLARPLVVPTLTLNGVQLPPVAFAGMTPSAVGLYQINFQIPANTPNGDLTLLISQGGSVSNTVTLPVHN